MKVPCRLVFSGVEKDVNKVKMHLKECNMKVGVGFQVMCEWVTLKMKI